MNILSSAKQRSSQPQWPSARGKRGRTGVRSFGMNLGIAFQLIMVRSTVRKITKLEECR